MKVIYNCYGGAHSSVVAGYIHCGLLRKDKIPTKQQLMSLAYYDSQQNLDHGILQYIGIDEQGNEIYSVGLKSERQFSEKCLENIAVIMGIDTDSYIFVDTISKVNWYMRIGGFLSRALGLTIIGRPLVIYGTQRAFFDICQLVEEICEKLRGEKK
ncbi:Protein of unknown function [Anaerobranca californiensis DSM 14826]|uniref:DUF3189 domain-containing protein n=1 Tax=Anaerobranca californiensis DSM 14826 TaxID=1120989 RepID=A0A1M6N738_9FIRM|nr:DUF3189 family protein [Anaerobranca californiensis]SHJ91528.1 Protein of unknown function [Anaerobranca californiensis DSM 14826]